ncbi:putative transmembrane protein [Senna tora]|uniref:Putative transmembrane protein n=1 Tax=Senna tora TaxID=362788 RepID=A0A834TBZ2_9FABA|nr:putative transmembrane protein [Senna tora]
MEKKALLIILLALSYLLFVTAVPVTRSLVTKKVDPSPISSVQYHQAKEGVESEMKERAEEKKMMMEVEDYSGPKANPAHQPKSPGKPN